MVGLLIEQKSYSVSLLFVKTINLDDSNNQKSCQEKEYFTE